MVEGLYAGNGRKLDEAVLGSPRPPSLVRSDRVAGLTKDLDAEALALIRAVEPGPGSLQAEALLAAEQSV